MRRDQEDREHDLAEKRRLMDEDRLRMEREL
jgi:hypothetical protein